MMQVRGPADNVRIFVARDKTIRRDKLYTV